MKKVLIGYAAILAVVFAAIGVVRIGAAFGLTPYASAFVVFFGSAILVLLTAIAWIIGDMIAGDY